MRRQNAHVQTLATKLQFSEVSTFFLLFYTFDFNYIFFLSIYFYFFNIYKNKQKKTITIVEFEAFGVKCSEYFFEPSPNEIAALLICSINLTRVKKFGGNRHIYE